MPSLACQLWWKLHLLLPCVICLEELLYRYNYKNLAQGQRKNILITSARVLTLVPSVRGSQRAVHAEWRTGFPYHRLASSNAVELVTMARNGPSLRRPRPFRPRKHEAERKTVYDSL